MEILGELASNKTNLSEHKSIWYSESMIFNEVANPEISYKYEENDPNSWLFNDKYGNIIGVSFDVGTRYVDSFFILMGLDGRQFKAFDVEPYLDKITPESFSGGSDELRSNTIAKIIRDEIVPRFLNNKPSIIKIHPIDEYRHKIMYKIAEIVKEKYPNIDIKLNGKEIFLVNK